MVIGFCYARMFIYMKSPVCVLLTEMRRSCGGGGDFKPWSLFPPASRPKGVGTIAGDEKIRCESLPSSVVFF